MDGNPLGCPAWDVPFPTLQLFFPSRRCVVDFCDCDLRPPRKTCISSTMGGVGARTWVIRYKGTVGDGGPSRISISLEVIEKGDLLEVVKWIVTWSPVNGKERRGDTSITGAKYAVDGMTSCFRRIWACLV